MIQHINRGIMYLLKNTASHLTAEKREEPSWFFPFLFLYGIYVNFTEKYLWLFMIHDDFYK